MLPGTSSKFTGDHVGPSLGGKEGSGVSRLWRESLADEGRLRRAGGGVCAYLDFLGEDVIDVRLTTEPLFKPRI